MPNAEGRSHAFSAAVGALVEVSSKLLDRVPLGQAPKVYLTFVLTLAFLFAALLPPYAPWYKILCLVLFGFSVWLVLGSIRRKRQLRPLSGRTLSPKYVRKTFNQLEKTRSVVREALAREGHTVPDKDLRANLFVPVREDGKKKLTIYPGMCINMHRERERLVAFDVGQGATGLAFASGKAHVVERLDDEDAAPGGWSQIYNISGTVAKDVHPDLQWIMSMPLLDDRKAPIGVLNIDCLRKRVSFDDLNRIMIQKALLRAAATGKVFQKGMKKS